MRRAETKPRRSVPSSGERAGRPQACSQERTSHSGRTWPHTARSSHASPRCRLALPSLNEDVNFLCCPRHTSFYLVRAGRARLLPTLHQHQPPGGSLPPPVGHGGVFSAFFRYPPPQEGSLRG